MPSSCEQAWPRKYHWLRLESLLNIESHLLTSWATQWDSSRLLPQETECQKTFQVAVARSVSQPAHFARSPEPSTIYTTMRSGSRVNVKSKSMMRMINSLEISLSERLSLQHRVHRRILFLEMRRVTPLSARLCFTKWSSLRSCSRS